jgi:hypothetical protein
MMHTSESVIVVAANPVSFWGDDREIDADGDCVHRASAVDLRSRARISIESPALQSNMADDTASPPSPFGRL